MQTPRAPWAFSPASLALLLTCSAVVPPAASAQVEPDRSWAVVPYLGFGVVRVNESWNSAGVEAALDLEYGGTGWRWGGYASLRGLGVGCSEACFEGGPALAIGLSRSVGPLWLGGGVGGMKQHSRWRLLPYGRISVDAAPVRLDLRVELPQQTGSGVYFPVLVGVPIPRRMR